MDVGNWYDVVMVVVLLLKVARAACSGLGRIGNDVATGAGAIA